VHLYGLGRGSKYGYCGLSWTKHKWIDGASHSSLLTWLRLMALELAGYVFCYVMVVWWFLLSYFAGSVRFLYYHTMIVLGGILQTAWLLNKSIFCQIGIRFAEFSSMLIGSLGHSSSWVVSYWCDIDHRVNFATFMIILLLGVECSFVLLWKLPMF